MGVPVASAGSKPCHSKPLPSRSRGSNTDTTNALLIQPFVLHREAETWPPQLLGASGSTEEPTVASARRAWENPGLHSPEAHSSDSLAPGL